MEWSPECPGTEHPRWCRYDAHIGPWGGQGWLPPNPTPMILKVDSQDFLTRPAAGHRQSHETWRRSVSNSRRSGDAARSPRPTIRELFHEDARSAPPSLNWEVKPVMVLRFDRGTIYPGHWNPEQNGPERWDERKPGTSPDAFFTWMAERGYGIEDVNVTGISEFENKFCLRAHGLCRRWSDRQFLIFQVEEGHRLIVASRSPQEPSLPSGQGD